jgi:hypothetical protein
VAAGAALAAAPVAILAHEYVLDLPKLMPSLPQVVSNGLLPTGALVLLVLGFSRLMRWRYAASRIEAVQAVFTLLAVGFVVLTVIGVVPRREHAPGLAVTGRKRPICGVGGSRRWAITTYPRA